MVYLILMAKVKFQNSKREGKPPGGGGLPYKSDGGARRVF